MVATLLLYTASSNALEVEPWGKDADLVSQPCVDQPCRAQGIAGLIAELGIAFHQTVISPADGPRSHYYPSSSQYTLEAMRKYGFFMGWLMGCDRLMRENSELWIYRNCYAPDGTVMKYDPVR